MEAINAAICLTTTIKCMSQEQPYEPILGENQMLISWLWCRRPIPYIIHVVVCFHSRLRKWRTRLSTVGLFHLTSSKSIWIYHKRFARWWIVPLGLRYKFSSHLCGPDPHSYLFSGRERMDGCIRPFYYFLIMNNRLLWLLSAVVPSLLALSIIPAPPVACNLACRTGYKCQVNQNGPTCVPDAPVACNRFCPVGYKCQVNPQGQTCVPDAPLVCNPACRTGYVLVKRNDKFIATRFRF